jgi:Bromodomain
LKNGGYTDFDEFVRDVAQVFYNAKVYNNRGSEVFEDAVTLEVILSSFIAYISEFTGGRVETASSARIY